VKAILSEGNFDVVHMHEPLMPLLPYYFLRHSRAANIGTFHAAKDGGNRVYEYTRSFTRRYFRQLDGKIAVSPAAVNLVSRYFPGYYNIIPNGIDYERFAADCAPLPEFQDGKTNILFVGRPEKRKGLKYLVRGYAMLKQTMPNLRLIVVGAGNFSRYEKAARDVGDIVFRSHVPQDDLPRYYRSANIFCAPNTGNESQGYVIMEALASGLPVVASNIEGFAGVITSEVDGLLVRPRDHMAIAQAITRLIDDAVLRESLARHGQVRAEQFSWDTVAHRVLSYYERLLYERRQVDEARERTMATAR
jgi:phosphatidylinositol alpha-mannosyltransferase